MFEAEATNKISSAISNAELFVDRHYLSRLSNYPIKALDITEKKAGYVQLYQIAKIIYDEKEDICDKLTGVYNAVRNFNSSVVLLLRGLKNSAELYIGVRAKQDVTIASNVLCKGLLGNFPGSEVSKLSNDAVGALFDETLAKGSVRANVACVNIVPSMRSEHNDAFIQGLEKLIDTMRGDEYVCQIIAKPVDDEGVALLRSGYEDLFTVLNPFAKASVMHGRNEGRTLTRGITETLSEAVNEGIAKTTGKNRSRNRATTSGFNVGFSVLASFGFTESNTDGVTILQTGTNFLKALENNT